MGQNEKQMEQITIEEYLKSKPDDEKPIEYGARGCRVCFWWKHEKAEGCFWNDTYHLKDMQRSIYPDCSFMPNSSMEQLHMCESCKYLNVFVYKGTDIKNPEDEPNIYCTCRGGSINRRTEYKDLERAGYGIGLYHRQHEYDTCDRWEPRRRRF